MLCTKKGEIGNEKVYRNNHIRAREYADKHFSSMGYRAVVIEEATEAKIAALKAEYERLRHVAYALREYTAASEGYRAI